jgi:hypothetical protein
MKIEMYQKLEEFERVGIKAKSEVQRALLPLGLYAFKVSSSLGTGQMIIETRYIDFGSKRELQLLKDEGLFEFLDEKTLTALREEGLIP